MKARVPFVSFLDRGLHTDLHAKDKATRIKGCLGNIARINRRLAKAETTERRVHLLGILDRSHAELDYLIETPEAKLRPPRVMPEIGTEKPVRPSRLPMKWDALSSRMVVRNPVKRFT